MKNFKLIIEYDGSAYHGWQVQKNEPTIQGKIQKALSIIMPGQKITLNGSGRTDAGVHALGQTANFCCDTRLKPENFQRGLNGLLDDDIIIRDCQEVPEDFHARFNAIGKTYNYRILNRFLPSVIDRNYVWFIRSPLDIDAMNRAADYIMGSHDFKAFEGVGSPRVHTVRCISKAVFIKENDGYLTFHINGDGFLRFMVRNITGTLVDVGLGKITPENFQQILLSKDRNKAGITAPPQGLFLINVDY